MIIYFAGNSSMTLSERSESFPRGAAARELVILHQGVRRRLHSYAHWHDPRYLEEWLKFYRRQGYL